MRIGWWVGATLALIACVSAGCGGDNFQFCNGCPTNTPTVTPTETPEATTSATPTLTAVAANVAGLELLTPAAPVPTPLAPDTND